MRKTTLLFLFVAVLSIMNTYSQITWMGNEYTSLGTQYLGDKILFEIQSYPIAANQGAQVYIDWNNDGYGTIQNEDWFNLSFIQNVDNNSKWNAYVTMKYVGTHNRKYLGWQSGQNDHVTGNMGTFIVTALSDPSSPAVTKATSSSLDLAWTKWNGKNVMVVRRFTSAAVSDAPVQGTAYSVGTALGTGTVVYNGSAENLSDTGLSASTDYTYLFYSENNGYYSSGTTVSAQTAVATEVSRLEHSLKISGISGKISAIFEGEAKVQLFNAAGRLLRSVNATNEFSQAVKPGVYILKVNDIAHKVIVE